MEQEVCPTHGVPTLGSIVFQPSDERVTVGSILGERYRVDRELGAGSIGSVFGATQLGLGRRVAVKILKDIMKPGTHVRRFYQEAQAVSLLSHPNLVSVLDFGVDHRTHLPYLAMDLVEGQTLRKIIEAEQRVPERRALSLVAQMARGLAEAHAKNVIHRDLKPENIMVSKLADGNELVKILDFGMATVLTSDGERAQRITATGTTVGTPLYMSPEQVRSSLVDFRSDLYSLGCILFELLAGSPPFVSDRVVDVMTMHLKNPPPSLPPLLGDGRAPTSELADLIRWLLEKQREKRPKATSEVADILDRLAHAGDEERRSLPIPQASTEIATGRSDARPVLDSGAGLDSEKPTMLKPSDYDAKDEPDEEAPQSGLQIPDMATLRAPAPKLDRLSQLSAPAEAKPRSKTMYAIAGLGVVAIAVAIAATPKADVQRLELPPVPETPRPSAPSTESVDAKAAQIRKLWPSLSAELDARLAEVRVASTAEARRAAEARVLALAQIEVASEPPGATVFDGLSELGACPLSLPRPTAGSRVLRVAKEGFVDAAVTLEVGSPSQLSIALAPP
ncbi:MAG: serine/threonine protein kinase [Deltaproteobacteria bacterium]|nr:serine/threonine protein kinase [Deltaproteobacteria bacterium]